jgi:hypothetical protein
MWETGESQLQSKTFPKIPVGYLASVYEKQSWAPFKRHGTVWARLLAKKYYALVYLGR